MKLSQIIPYLNGFLSRISPKVQELDALRGKIGLPDDVNYKSHINNIERQKETANKNFTIAFVGMFNSGKSTIINSLLELKGNKRLSDEDSPDTAKSTRLSFRFSEEEPEAILYFSDGTTQKCCWEEARNFTSQVYMDEHPSIKAKADKLVEVEYFISHPILRFCDFIDLPGTGTKNWQSHTQLTHERLREAEVVFWVMATCVPEPSASDMEDLKILKEIKSNVIPFINVWSDKEEGVSGSVSAEEMEDSIKSNFSSFFSSKAIIIKYYAKEIDKANQKGKEQKKEWGLDTFRDFLKNEYLDNFDKKSKEKVRRIAGSVNSSIDKLLECISSDESEIEILKKKIEEQDEVVKEEEIEWVEIGSELRGKLRDIAQEKSDIIIDKCINLSAAFIDDQMQLTNVKPLINKIGSIFTKKNIDKELSEKFKNDYLKLNEKPNWLENILKDYFEDSKIVVESRWIRFVKDFNSKLTDENKSLNVDFNFTQGFLGQMIGGLIEKALTSLLSIGGVIAVILLTPAGQIAVAAAIIFASIGILSDPLGKYRNSAKLKAKVIISNQRYELKNQIAEIGIELHNECSKKFQEILKDKGLKIREEEANINKAKEIISEIKDIVLTAKEDINHFEKGE